MSKYFYNYSFLLFFLISASVSKAQSVALTGIIKDKATQKELAGASIEIKGKLIKTITKPNGRFTLKTTGKTSYAIVISHEGYKSIEKSITSSPNDLLILLEEDPESASKNKVIESALNLTYLGQEKVVNAASSSFYNDLSTSTGVETNSQGMLFRSINTRGFNSIGNPRFVQYIDGMDTQSPGFNFSFGNILGVSDLEVDQVALLAGAAPGFGGINGTLRINTKSPFTDPGLSTQFRVGLNHLNSFQQQGAPWEDMSMRYARILNKRLAVKASVSYSQGEDWHSTDPFNFDRLNMRLLSGTRNTDPAYDGVNYYGDEPDITTPTLNQQGAIVKEEHPNTPCNCLPEPDKSIVRAYNQDLLPKKAVTRTGYSEQSLLDYGTKSLKTSGAVHYKISNTIEAIAQANWRVANSVYTDVDRYSLHDYNLGQFKLELKGRDFSLRGYTTQEHLGEGYNVTLLGNQINEQWKSSPLWIREYTGAFAKARLQGVPEAEAHLAARQFADNGRPEEGSGDFNRLKETLSNWNIDGVNGAKLYNRSNLYHYEGVYDFSNSFMNKVNLAVGPSYRKYNLSTDGTIFSDYNRNIGLSEYGSFVQLGKRFFDKFKLTGSLRMDKNENFETLFSPGLRGIFDVSSHSNIRASYQQSYRNPTLQNQYLDLKAAGGGMHLIGGLPEMISQYDLYINKPYTAESYQQVLATGDASLLQQYTFADKGIQPESVQAFELGYRGLFGKKFLLDAYSFYNIYTDYISTTDVYQNLGPATASGFQNVRRFLVPVNAKGNLSSWGLGLGLNYNLRKFSFAGNVAYNKLEDLPQNFYDGFNTPEVMFNLGISSKEIVKRVGFNLLYRWQDDFDWRSSFVKGRIPAFGTLDGQLSFKMPAYKSVIKVGGSNLLNSYYQTSFGNPTIGGMYYVSLLFNEISR